MPTPGGLKGRWKSGNEELSDRVRERENWKQDGQEPCATSSKCVFGCKLFLPEYFVVCFESRAKERLTDFHPGLEKIPSFKIRILLVSA